MIEVSHLTKKYGDYLAVDDLSFTIENGHIYGFLGPNGAGKSTTMNIMTGCLAATSGDVSIDGHDIFEEPKEAKKLIGYLPELPPLYVEQTVREYLNFVARAKGFSGKARAEEVNKVISEAHIESVSDKLIMHLSKGFRQRVGIAQAIIGNPDIIILDEPTVGLDPMQIIEIRDFIRQLGQNHTVIISSHILSEIQAVCEKVLIIHHGKLLAFDTLENLGRTISSGNTIQLRADCTAEQLKAVVASVEEGCSVEIDATAAADADAETADAADAETTCAAETADATAADATAACAAVVHVSDKDPRPICRQLFAAFAKEGIVLEQLNPVSRSLEDVFIELTRDAQPSAPLSKKAAEPDAAEDPAAEPDAAEDPAAEPTQEPDPAGKEANE